MKVIFNAITYDYECLFEIDENIKEIIKSNIKHCLDDFSKTLPLTYLEEIIICENYDAEINAFEEKNNLKKTTKTNNKYGNGSGCFRNLECDSKINYYIFIDKNYAQYFYFYLNNDDSINKNLSESDPNSIIMKKKLAINLLHHEYMHVYEHFLKKETKIYLDIIKKDELNFAIQLWQEYYACRKSSSTYYLDMLNEDKKEFIKNLEEIEDTIMEKRKNCLDKKISYKEFNSYFSEYIQYILINFVYILGYVHCLNCKDKENFIKNINNELEKYKIYSCCTIFKDILEDLFISFPEWDSIKDIELLSQLITVYEGKLGVFRKNSSLGTYIKFI